MTSFAIRFSYPWLLFAIIPVLLAVLIPYFMINKKYRNTRNRIVSIILHVTAMTLAILMLAGMRFEYNVSLTTNEMIVLVDMSDSENYSETERDMFVRDIVNEGANNGFGVGVVTFGFDQVYASEINKDITQTYDNYLNAKKPDVSATDIEAAIKYTAGIFKNPETAKIILVTDGKETDENSVNAVKYVTAQNTKLDVMYIPSEYTGKDARITEITFPETNVQLNVSCNITITIASNFATDAVISMIDNNGEKENLPFAVSEGVTQCSFPHTFTADGIHKIDVTMTVDNDGVEQNNKFSTYYDLERYNKVLLISRSKDAIEEESQFLNDLLSEDNLYNVTSTTFGDPDCPDTLQELREYNQVILNNISNADMQTQEGFDEMLQSYLYDYGGSLITTGGSDGEELDELNIPHPVAHAYNRKDMYSGFSQETLYQQMLPVQSVAYTPPVGVMFLIDISGSMGGGGEYDENNNSKWAYAKRGIEYALDKVGEDEDSTLSPRDYCGIIATNDAAHMVLPLTSVTNRSAINKAIRNMPEPTGGTAFADSVRLAIAHLSNNTKIKKRHIIMLTDGQIQDLMTIEDLASRAYKEHGITFSIVITGQEYHDVTDFNNRLLRGELKLVPGEGSDDNYERLMRVVWLSNDTQEVSGNPQATESKRLNVFKKLMMSVEPSDILPQLRADVSAPDIKQVELTDFYPVSADIVSPIFSGVLDTSGETFSDKLPIVLSGFYGTKIRPSAKLLIKGEYEVPIYAQWNYGKGKVGSFAIDLYGQFSQDLIDSEQGKTLILNVVKELLPLRDLSTSGIETTITEDNYHNTVSVMTSLEEDERISGTISWREGNVEKTVSLDSISKNPDPTVYVTLPLEASNNYSRFSFVAKNTGTYTITLKKLAADGSEKQVHTFYKSFSYSKEYDATTATQEEITTKLGLLADGGNGVYNDDVLNLNVFFENVELVIHNEYDPRILFAILIIVMFLLDIAVRKFKFKWLHEIIRERKDKRFKNHKK